MAKAKEWEPSAIMQRRSLPNFEYAEAAVPDRDRARLGRHRRRLSPWLLGFSGILAVGRAAADDQRLPPVWCRSAHGWSRGALSAPQPRRIRRQQRVEPVGCLVLDPVSGAGHHGEARRRLKAAQDARRARRHEGTGGRVALAPDPVEPRRDLGSASTSAPEREKRRLRMRARAWLVFCR